MQIKSLMDFGWCHVYTFLTFFRLEEMENERNQEMEEICAAVVEDSNSPADGSSFSFPSSGAEDLWHDHFDDDIDQDTDQDRTLTTLTLHTTSSPPDSAAAMKHYYDSSHPGHAGNGYYLMSQAGSLSGLFSNSGTGTTTATGTSFSHTSYLPQQHQPPRYSSSHGPFSLNLANGNGIHLNGGNGSVVPNGNGGLSGMQSSTTFFMGYTRTTAV